MKNKIVFYGVKSFPSRGGTDRVAENLIIQLKEKFDITLYCFKDPLAKNYIKGIEVIEFVPLVRGSIGVFIYFLFTAVHLMFSKNVDLVHAHKTDCAFFIPLLKLRFKVIATSHEAPYKRDKWNWIVKLYFHVVEYIFIKSPDVPTCISKPLTEYYSGKYKKKVLFIPNGINVVDAKKYKRELIDEFIPDGATLDKPFILFSARRLMATKGCHTMLDALHRIHYKGQVFIAGELKEKDEYLKLLRGLSNGLDVHFLGFVNPLSSLLTLVHHAKLFIFPSETEGMSIMLLEVASVGRIIIASDIPENTQVFSNDEVLYFKSKDPNDLGAKIDFALNNPDKTRQLEINCQKKVFSDYLWSNIALSYAKIYENLLQIG